MESDQRTSTPPKEQDSKAAEKKGTVNPSQSPATTTTTNVYVRRKVEIDASKDTLTKQSKVSSSSTVPPPDWEERYHHLQMNLNKLNESDQTDSHLHMLWSLPSAELSKHAVDLEKRSIQLSLEEAREMQRVAALNVLGRDYDEFKVKINALVATTQKMPQEGWTMQDGPPWAGNNVRNHPNMIQVFLGHSGVRDTYRNELPRLVCVSHENLLGFEHHKEAGAMNYLLRMNMSSFGCSKFG